MWEQIALKDNEIEEIRKRLGKKYSGKKISILGDSDIVIISI